MRILMIHNKYGVLSGEELMAGRIINMLDERGHKVESLFEDGVPPDAGWDVQIKAFFSGIYCPESVRKVKERVRNFRPDLVQVQNLYPSLSPWVLPVVKQEGIPVVMRCANYRLVCPNGLFLSHGRVCERCMGGREHWCLIRNCEGSLPKSLGYALRNFVARIWRLYQYNVTLYYAQTEFQKKKLVQGGIPREQIEVIPNMVETSISLIETPVGHYVGFAGRISPEKGVSTLLQAGNNLPDIPFRLAGDFSRMPNIYKGKPHNVELVGHLEGTILEKFFKNCRLLVFPSTCYEGFPGAVIEAMLYGKPVVCSRIGSLPEIVEDGVNGLLFEPGDLVDLAAKIAWLWSKPELCVEMGKRGRHKVLNEFSPAKYYERLMNVYERALDFERNRS
jgi:glycosyltransferase involved in cell wall biosynthesis